MSPSPHHTARREPRPPKRKGKPMKDALALFDRAIEVRLELLASRVDRIPEVAASAERSDRVIDDMHRLHDALLLVWERRMHYRDNQRFLRGLGEKCKLLRLRARAASLLSQSSAYGTVADEIDEIVATCFGLDEVWQALHGKSPSAHDLP